MESKQSFSTSEVARFCHVTPDTIRKWAEAGRIPVFKTPGGHRRIRRDDLLQFLTDNGIPVPPGLRPNGTRLLVVDDDSSIVSAIQKVLDGMDRDFEVSVAHDGFDAGHLVGTLRPNVVFLDLRLPGIDGYEVCRRIKSSPNTAQTEVIAMTGYFEADTVTRVTDVGAVTCLKKPFSGEELREALEMVGVGNGKP